jgi:methanogenic corrinoid protein MtbC1
MQKIGQGSNVQHDRTSEIERTPLAPLVGQGGGRARTSVEAIRAAGTAPIYNIAAVSRLSGVPAATLRAWERRYGYPDPRRTMTNRRGYSDQDLLALRWLRERLDEGLTISAAVALLSEQLAMPSPPTPTNGHPPAAVAGQLADALLGFDEARADRVLGEAFALHAVESVCLDVLQPVMSGIGDGWQAGEIDVSQEHFASTYVRQRLASLLHLSSASRPGRLVVTAAAPDDWHELGILTVALFLARHGWRVIHLGSSLPVDDLLLCVERLRPTAVVISASTPATAATLSVLAARLAAQHRPEALLGFGGQIFEADPALRDLVPALYLGPSAATAVERLDDALTQAGA